MKRNRPSLYLLSVFILISCLIFGCTKELISSPVDDVMFALKVAPRTSVGENLDGVTIRSLRIIVVDVRFDNIIRINRLIDQQEEEATGLVLNLQQGAYKVCVIANETSAMKPFLESSTNLSDISNITLITPTTENDLVLYKNVDFLLRKQSVNPEEALVSVDGGNSWNSPSTIDIKLERVASKISLFIKKNTVNVNDKFEIKKVELVNIPGHTYLIPGKAYSGDLHRELSFYEDPGVSFVSNGETNPIFTDYIIPEYILSNPGSSLDASSFIITASYTKYGTPSQDVEYMIPVLGQDAANYSIDRNTHYKVTATIVQSMEIDHPLSVEYEVSKWDIAGNGSFDMGEITSSGNWAPDTNLADGIVEVANNTSAAYEFTLSFPPGAKWKAQLSNFLDFDFDLSGGAVREGIAQEGVGCKIKVTPRRAVSTNDVMTEFYITVDNGIENIELDLTKNGTGKRYIIKQIPN